MTRVPVVLALLLLAAASSAHTVDNLYIQVTVLGPPETGTASSTFVSVQNIGATPIPPFDLVMTLHGHATLQVPSTDFFTCTAESPRTTRCRSGGALQATTVYVAPVISPVLERRLALVTYATMDDGGEQRSTGSAVMGVVFPRPIEVTNRGDEGPGTLRAAIESANASCTGIPCAIVFNLPPPATILPNTPLPAITAPDVIIDGRVAGPAGSMVELDGDALWYGSGLDFIGTGLFTVRDLHIRRFPWDGIAVTRRNDDPLWRSVIGNNLVNENGSRGIIFNPPASGVEITLNAIVGNARSGVFIEGGLDIVVQNNAIYDNRASGVYVSAASQQVDVARNELRQNSHWGVTIGRGARLVELIDNRIYENGIAAIDVGVDGFDGFVYDPGHDRVGPPILTSATVSQATGHTTITGTVPSLTGDWDITFYASALAGSGHGVLGHTTATNGTFTFVHHDRLMPGSFVIASAVHRLNGEEWQTEMSNLITVQ